MITTPTDTTIHIDGIEPVHIFPNVSDMLYWMGEGAVETNVHLFNGITKLAKEGTYRYNDQYGASAHTIYVRQYETPQTHPDVPFKYTAWAVVNRVI